MAKSNGEILDRLFAVILSRREVDPAESYVAQQFQAGTSRIAQKVGEEAVGRVEVAQVDREVLTGGAERRQKRVGFGKRRSLIPLDDIVGGWRTLSIRRLCRTYSS